MEQKDLISIIVPIYNTEKYLEQCIESIINQTYSELEIILVDDGSTDKSAKICDEYAKKDKRIIVVHKKNEGVSKARNIGIEMSSGKWISFVDSDDWIEKNYIEYMLKENKKENSDIVICKYNRIIGKNIEKIELRKNEKKIFDRTEYLIESLNPQTGFGFCHMKLYKRNAIGNIRFKEQLSVGEDALFNIMISKNIQKATIDNKLLYNYRINEKSTVKKYDTNYADKYLNSMKECKEYILKNYSSDKRIIQNYYNFVAYHYLLVAVNYCYHPDNKEKNKLKLLKQTSNYLIFKEGIKNSNYEKISLTRKISLFTLKHKLYKLTEIICKIRQRQNHKGEDKWE